MTIEELKAKRMEVLEVREANRLGKNSQKIEDECNAKLRKFNLAISGEAPWVDEPKRRTRKKKDVLE